MPSIDVEIEVYCDRCGAGLCGDTNVINKRNQSAFSVSPCSRCLEREYDLGYNKGYGVRDAEGDR